MWPQMHQLRGKGNGRQPCNIDSRRRCQRHLRYRNDSFCGQCRCPSSSSCQENPIKHVHFLRLSSKALIIRTQRIDASLLSNRRSNDPQCPAAGQVHEERKTLSTPRQVALTPCAIPSRPRPAMPRSANYARSSTARPCV